MKIVSIQVGLPKEVEFRGKVVTTGIFKEPVKGPILVKLLNLSGDGQADLSVHGGPDKAVYAYSVDAFPWWKNERPHDQFEYGAFGENLSIDQMPEDQTYIGDTFEVGTAVLQVAQPRFPCYKLGVKFEDPSILKTFMKSKRPGVYFRVIQEGQIDSGQEFKLVDREETLLSVSELFISINSGQIDKNRAENYLKIASLPRQFREKFETILATR